MIKSEWMDIAARMNRIWPNQPIQDDTAVEWFLLLRDLETRDVDDAITILASVERFPPPAGIIRSKVVELQVNAPTWAVAWAEIWEVVCNFGSYGHLEPGRVLSEPIWRGRGAEVDEHVWSSPEIEQTVRLAGWEDLTRCDVADVRTLEAQVRGKYQSVVETAKADRLMAGIDSNLPRIQDAKRRLGNGSLQLPSQS